MNKDDDLNQPPTQQVPHERVVMRITEVCPECGMNHRNDVLEKEHTQERMRHLRLALRIATGWNNDRYKDCLAAAEEQMTTVHGA